MSYQHHPQKRPGESAGFCSGIDNLNSKTGRELIVARFSPAARTDAVQSAPRQNQGERGKSVISSREQDDPLAIRQLVTSRMPHVVVVMLRITTYPQNLLKTLSTSCSRAGRNWTGGQCSKCEHRRIQRLRRNTKH
jgi:hypothetical protein